MTLVMPWSRLLAQRIGPRSQACLTRLTTPSVGFGGLCATRFTLQSSTKSVASLSVPTTFRNYATSGPTARVGRPKAHTGKSTTKKTKAKSTAAKNPTTRKTGGRKTTGKVKAKAKLKPKPKRKIPSASALKKAAVVERKSLTEKALLTEPKKLPENAWQVYFVQNKPQKLTQASEIPQHTRDIAASYRSLSPLERERLNHTANENKATNERTYQQWLSKYEPVTIKEANNARKRLAALKRKSSTKSKRVQTNLIKDDRLVKQPRNAFSFYNVDRFASGDYKHMTLKETGALIGREWRELSSSEKQPYVDKATQDLNRYIEEYNTVYGVDLPSRNKGKRAT